MNCETCMYYNFVKVICTGDTSFVDGDENWSAISEEYAELKQDTKQKQWFIIQKNVALLEYDLFLIQTIVNQMRVYPSKELGELLRMGFGYSYAYDENLTGDLEMTITEAKAKLFELDELKNDLTELQSKNVGVPNEMDYVREIAAYSKWVGYRIDWKTTSVKEYIGIQLLSREESQSQPRK